MGEIRGRFAALLLLFLLLTAGCSLALARSSYAGAISGLTYESDFAIRYCIHESHTGDPPYSSDAYLFVYSNGTTTCQFNSTSGWGTSSTNWTTQLSSAMVSELYDVMMSDGFMELDDSYDDLGWFDTWQEHLERACIEISGQLKTVSFHGRSMIGIAPGSYAILNNMFHLVVQGLTDLSDATLDISVAEPTGGGAVANVSANFTNNGDSTLSDSGLCNVSWPLFIVSVNGTSVGDLQKNVVPYCYMEFDPGTTTDFGPWHWNRTGLSPGSYVIMSRVCIWDYVIGNISSDSSWIPSDDDPETEDGLDVLYIGLAGIGVGLVVGVAAVYFFRARRARV